MKKLEITEKQLKQDETLSIDTLDKDDFRTATLEFTSKLGGKFLLWFNGKLIHSSKGFKSLLNRFNKLNENFSLDFDSQREGDEDK